MISRILKLTLLKILLISEKRKSAFQVSLVLYYKHI